MQIVRVLFCILIIRQLFVVCHPNTCALFWPQDLQLPVQHLTTLVLFLSALPLNPQAGRLSENTNSSRAFGSGPWGRNINPASAYGARVFLRQLECYSARSAWDLACLGSLESSSFLPFLWIATVPLLGMFSAKPGFNHKHWSPIVAVYSLSNSADPVNDRQATAGLNQEVKSPWRSRQTPVQRIKILFDSFILSPNVTDKYLLCLVQGLDIYLFIYLPFRNLQASGEPRWKQRAEPGRPTWD